MIKSATDEARARRASRSLAFLVGASLAALGAGGALAQGEPAAVATASEPTAAPVIGPATDPVAETTGSVDRDDAAPAESPAGTVAPAPATPAALDAARPVDPISSAVAALVATGAPGLSALPASDRAALIAFYAARNGAPVWTDAKGFTPGGETARARILAAEDDGLDVKRFAPPAAPATAEPTDIAKADVGLTASALAYARQAWGGRLNPATISRSISIGTPPFDAAAALVALAASPDAAATLDGFNPPHAEFQALRKLLAEKRAEQRDRPAIIPEGKLIKPGVEDDRVPALRVRLKLPERPGDLAYDDELAAAVTAFQKTKKLGASGLVNRQTLRALNAEARIDPTTLLLVNMERWRWMPRDLGAKHVFVDLADFHLHIVENGRETYETRVIIGKPGNATPILSSAINQVVVNPYWNVPVSIAMNEMAGGSLRGFEVVDARGRVVDPGAVSWEAIRGGKMRIRQAPGERNALGHIKFLFPNRYAVYLHDTPSRKLFGNDYRALSHGCVRVDRPLEFADALTGDQDLPGEKLKKMVGGKERGLTVARTIPVHLAYFTAATGADGALETRSDLYGLDARMSAALAGEALPPLPAEPVIARAPRPKPERRPQPAAVAQVQAEQQAMERAAQRPGGLGSWLSRVFGDSRDRP